MKGSKVDFRLYLITDRKLVTRSASGESAGADHSSLVAAAEEALKGGVKAVQLREKDLGTRELLSMAYMMRELTNKYNAKLFINDRVDIALAVEADGVHLGQKSIPPSAVRRIAGGKLTIGVSTHGIKEAVEAEKDGANFVTLGPIYSTPAKLKYGKPIGVDIIRKAKAEISIPVFVIGGIKEDKIDNVMGAGADGIALISGILGAKDIKERAEDFLKLIGMTTRELLK